MTEAAPFALLKRNPETRHIPVHVISADDQKGLGLSMGAFGFTHKPVEREVVDSLVAGTPVTASRGPVVQDFKHVSRVLAGFEDDLVDEGGAGGAATMVGLEIARKHHWHAPAYSGSETADASNAEVGDAHVGEANSSADRATSAGAPKDLEKGKDV